MLTMILSQIVFFAAIVVVVFMPGYFLLLAVFGKSKILSSLEKFVISSGLGIISVDFIFFAFTKANLLITRASSLIGLALFMSVCFLIYRLRRYAPDDGCGKESAELFNFSNNQIVLILLLLFSTFFIKIAYLSGTVFPTATDMGHHLYWIKWMVENSALPTYEGMPDFIIGEHIIFGITALISRVDFFSAFPVVLLLLCNISSILMVFLLSLRIFKQKNIAILTLLFLGVLYAVSSPQAKFISGGVMGNIIGNFLLPLNFYFYYRAFSFFEDGGKPEKKHRTFLSLAVFSTFGLLYTHHLTAFIFLFITAFFLLIFGLLNLSRLKEVSSDILRLISSPQVITVFFTGLVFFFFVFTPTYVQNNAVGTAVGEPSKDTRAGLTIANLRSSIGEARIAFGFVGMIILALAIRKKSFGPILIFSWAAMIFIMSTMPKLLLVNLPSSRIGNYLSYPLSIISAYAVWSVFTFSKDKKVNPLILTGFMVILAFVFIDGMDDSAKAFRDNSDPTSTAQTFDASSYLAKNTGDSDMVLKDHNYISSDTWIKLFFMRGYKYPLSRGYFKRYDDSTKPREMCTLQMIASPDSQEAQECFQETGTDFIMVNPDYDSSQFKKLTDFDQIYSASRLNIYYKK